jgi:hypothetical protein
MYVVRACVYSRPGHFTFYYQRIVVVASKDKKKVTSVPCPSLMLETRQISGDRYDSDENTVVQTRHLSSDLGHYLLLFFRDLFAIDTHYIDAHIL